MPNFPSTIPAEFASNDVLADAYRSGWNHAHGIACHNVPSMGETYWTDSDGRVTVETVDDAREVHASLCYEAESNSRSYSPFEFTAHEFNSAGYDGDRGDNDPVADDLWEAFETGVSDSLAADLATYEDSDYSDE